MEQNTIASYRDAVVLLSEIADFKDASSLKQQCEEKIEVLSDSQDMITETRYLKAKYLFDSKQYKEAATIFDELGYYNESSTMRKKSLIELVKEYIHKEEYQEAVDALTPIKSSSDAKQLYNQSVYNLGLQQFAKGEYKEGYDTLMSIRSYEDAKEQAQELYYQQGIKFYDDKEYDLSNEIFKTLGTYKDSKMLIHNHFYSEEVISELTCTEDSKCTQCGEIKETAVGHDIVNGVCKKCNVICIDPIVFEGSHSSLEEDLYTISVPKGNYKFTITTSLNTTTQRWTIKVDGSELYFGSSASKKSGTFTHEKTILKDNTTIEVSVRVNGKYTLTITPTN